MALQGTLETFSVPEVLRLLSGTRKSGLLALEGDRGGGNVFLAEGRIVAAHSDHEPAGRVEAVLFDLLRFTEGSFVFESEATAPDGGDIDLDVDDALAEAERLLAEWEEIASVVPSLDVGLTMVRAIAEDRVTVTAEQWETLAAVAGGTTGSRFGRDLGLGELDASRRIRDVVEAGLVEIDTIDLDLDPAPLVVEDETDPEVRRDAGHDTDLNVGLAGFVAQADEDETPALDELEDRDDAGEPDEFAGFEEEEPTVPVATADEGPIDEAAPTEADHEELESAAADEDTTDAGASAGEDDQDEFLSQLANLSPKAAAAIEATASADDTGDGPRLPDGEADEEINRNLLLKFLSSAKN